MADKLNRLQGSESLRKYYNSAYMGAYSIDTGAEPVLHIAEVLHGEITLDGGRKEEHVLLRFQEKSVSGLSDVKPLLLNATNQKTLEKLYGKGADVLLGKPVKLYIDPAVRAVGGGKTEGVRIRSYCPETANLPPCAACGGAIQAALGKDASYLAAYTNKHYGMPLCADCAAIRRQAAMDQAEGSYDETRH